MDDERRLAILREYASGQTGTRATIDKLGMRDYADLVMALAAADLPFPKPPDTPALATHRQRAHAILMPRLTHGR
jgi:hypothetical protein